MGSILCLIARPTVRRTVQKVNEKNRIISGLMRQFVKINLFTLNFARYVSCCRLLIFFQNKLFQRTFQDPYQSVERLVFRSGRRSVDIPIWVQIATDEKQSALILSLDVLRASPKLLQRTSKLLSEF